MGKYKGRPDRTYEVIARSNGHEWIHWHGMVICLTCGVVRRADDQNKPCKGPVKVTTRNAFDEKE